MPPSSSTSSSEELRSERRFRRYAAAFAVAVVAVFAALAWLPVAASRVEARRSFGDRDGITVWGDSRTLHALDIARIGAEVGRPVWSFSRPGSGPYDLMVVEEVVADGATVIVGPSLAMLARPVRLDSNRVGLSWRALARMWSAGYPLSTLHEIWVNNRYRLRVRHSQVHPVHDSADDILEEHLDAYRERLSGLDRRIFDRKWTLLWASIDRLLARGCKVYVIEAPVSSTFRRERRSSAVGDFPARVAEAAAKRGIPALLDVELPSAPNPMWDHTHLNERGRDRFTEMVLERWGAEWRRGTAASRERVICTRTGCA